MRARVAVVVLAAVLVFAAFLRVPQDTTESPRTAPASEADAPAPAGRQPAAVPPSIPAQASPIASTQASRRPVAQGVAVDFATHLAQLDRDAAAGDADAAAELGDLLSLCRDYAPMSAQDVEDTIVTGMATNEPAPLIGGKPALPEFLILLLQQGYAELDRHCAGSERLIDAARAKAAPDWLQRAAEAGGKAEVIFIGDSITQGWEGEGKDVWTRYYAPRNAVNLGIGGDRTQHVIWRIENGELDGLSPKALVLMIGTNNSGDNTGAQIAALVGRDAAEQDVMVRALDDVDRIDLHVAEVFDSEARRYRAVAKGRARIEALGVEPDAAGVGDAQFHGFQHFVINAR